MTQRIKISMPDEGGRHEAHVTVDTMNFYLAPGESMEAHIYKGQEIRIIEVPEGTKQRIAQEALAKAEEDLRAASKDDVKAADTTETPDPKPVAPVSDNETTSTVSMGSDKPADGPETGADAPELPADPAPEATEAKPKAGSKKS